MDCNRPRGIDDQSWQAIEFHHARMSRAWGPPTDEGSVIGAAKDLCECVARVVLEERAVPYSAGDDMHKLVNAAHATLDRRPGHGQAAQVNVRTLAQSARNIVTVISELRNELGSGHGRARIPKINHEVAAAASDAATMWVRWTLARLDDILGGDVDNLIQELRGHHFRRGLLEQRFDEVRLDSVPGDDQKRLGVAVAHRSMNGTFVVRESGVDPLEERPRDWPEDYRLGVASGLLLAPNGSLDLQSDFIPTVASIVALMRSEDWAHLTENVAGSPLEPSMAADRDRLEEIRTSLAEQARELPERYQKGWSLLIGRFSEALAQPPT